MCEKVRWNSPPSEEEGGEQGSGEIEQRNQAAAAGEPWLALLAQGVWLPEVS